MAAKCLVNLEALLRALLLCRCIKILFWSTLFTTSFKMFCCDCPADPIDLTKDGSDQDMQTALMLSMQDMQSSAGAGVLSLEEQELSRYVGRGVIRWSPLPGGPGT